MDSRLYLITAVRPDLAAFLEAAVQGGVDIVQIREKALADAELLPRLEEAREVTRRLGVPLVVNDRPDLAVLCEADFVHVGQDDFPVAAARSFGVGVGQSTHAAAEIDAADADYIGVGPVYARRPRKAVRRSASSSSAMQWLTPAGRGSRSEGSTRRMSRDVVAAGATRIAVVRAIGGADDPELAARALRDALGVD